MTVNTDFAQIEEDVQQINLTRFNLLFPEKRDFFLEGQGIFGFGGRNLAGRGSGDTDDVPIMFFSRQIGLAGGQTIPVRAGARVTGKAGPFDIAALNVETGDKRGGRGQRDQLLGRAAAPRHPAPQQRRRGRHGAQAARRRHQRRVRRGRQHPRLGEHHGARLLRAHRRRGRPGRRPPATGRASTTPATATAWPVEHLMVGPQFAPAVGYTRREDFRRDLATVRFSPRLTGNRYMRKLTWQGTFDYVTDAAVTTLANRSIDGSFGIEFHSGDQATVQYVDDYELIPQAFRIAPGVTIPAGGYRNHTLTGSYSLANQRLVAGRVAVSTGRALRRDAARSVLLRPDRAGSAVCRRARRVAGVGRVCRSAISRRGC